MKTRSSAGVGQKVDLAFDIAGLRISDPREDEEQKTEVQGTRCCITKLNAKQWQMKKFNPTYSR